MELVNPHPKRGHGKVPQKERVRREGWIVPRPLKRLYCEWAEKSFRFLIDKWVCFEEFPSESFLHASGLKGSKKLSFWAIEGTVEMEK
jgi:hypothetical protein